MNQPGSFDFLEIHIQIQNNSLNNAVIEGTLTIVTTVKITLKEKEKKS